VQGVEQDESGQTKRWENQHRASSIWLTLRGRKITFEVAGGVRAASMATYSSSEGGATSYELRSIDRAHATALMPTTTPETILNNVIIIADT